MACTRVWHTAKDIDDMHLQGETLLQTEKKTTM